MKICYRDIKVSNFFSTGKVAHSLTYAQVPLKHLFANNFWFIKHRNVTRMRDMFVQKAVTDTDPCIDYTSMYMIAQTQTRVLVTQAFVWLPSSQRLYTLRGTSNVFGAVPTEQC